MSDKMELNLECTIKKDNNTTVEIKKCLIDKEHLASLTALDENATLVTYKNGKEVIAKESFDYLKEKWA